MVLLDTNILVYASNRSSPLFKKAKEIRDRALKGQLKACISLQNLSEFYSVVTSSKKVKKPLAPQQTKQEIEKYLKCSIIKKLAIKPSTITLTMELAERYNITQQNIYDTQLVATMLENRVRKVVTRNDSDFSVFSEIETENPFP